MLGEITACWVRIEINCLQQIKDMSLNHRQPQVNLWAQRWASFSPRLIHISKWHIYIQQNMRLHFVLHLCWHLIQKTTAKRASLFSDLFKCISAFKHHKNRPRFYCDNGKVDWKSGFGIGLHIISCAIKMRFAAMGKRNQDPFLSY